MPRLEAVGGVGDPRVHGERQSLRGGQSFARNMERRDRGSSGTEQNQIAISRVQN